MHGDLVSASVLSGSTAAHMPAIWRRSSTCSNTRLGLELFWEHNWGT
jgi:hypothetical protein